MKKIALVSLFSLIGGIKAQTNYEVFGLAQDKQKHFATIAATTAMVNITAYDMFRDAGASHKEANRKSRIAGMVSAGVFSIGKEIADYRNHKIMGTWDDVARKDMWGDIGMGLLGGVTVTVTFKIFEK